MSPTARLIDANQLEHKAAALDTMVIPGKRLGIADTSALLRPDWIEDHPATKIVLWRDAADFNLSLRALGFCEVDPVGHAERIAALSTSGVRVYPWRSVFDAPVAKEICELLDVPYCPYRFEELRRMNIQPEWRRLAPSKEALDDFHARYLATCDKNHLRGLVMKAIR